MVRESGEIAPEKGEENVMSVEIWCATDYDFTIENSRTQPLVLWCQNENEARALQTRRFLVKSPGHPEVLEFSLFAELFGNLLAREFGLLTPAPALVILTDPFVAAVQPFLGASIHLRVGFGVGCEYLTPFTTWATNWQLPPALRAPATLIYAFDLLTANFDRRIGNPNCALTNGQILAYDFECSFSFLQALFGPKPWMVSQLGIAQKHVFQRPLAAARTDWTPFLEILKLIDERRLSELVKDLPTPWYLLEAQSHASQLEVELEKSLRL